jgi:arthrofactin-type cyclic lipopeptide synthetase C
MLQSMGIFISTSDLFAHPTIASLANQATPENAHRWANKARLIRKGHRRLNLFFTHCGSGELLYLHALTAHMDAGITLYGLPASPPDQTIPRTVEAMATRMVEMIRSVQPVGPYHLAGWSFGGTLAYEIAKQLIGSNQSVGFLGLLDAYSHGPASSTEESTLDSRQELLHLIESGASSANQDSSILSPLRSGEMDFPTLLERCRSLSLIPEHLSGYSASQMEHWLERAHTIAAASTRYRAQQLAIPVFLFAPKEVSSEEPDRGWKAVLPGQQLQLIPVQGTHHSMFEAPHVHFLGQSISRNVLQAPAGSLEASENTKDTLYQMERPGTTYEFG